MPSVVSKEDSKKLRVLKHPVRKRIIELLGSKENMSFTELKNEMNLPVGTLYYHLDVLKGYVLQDEERRYFLSKEGKNLYGMLATIQSSDSRNFPERTIFIPSWFFPKVGRKLSASTLCFAFISIIGGLTCYWAGQILVIEHYGISIFSSIVDAAFFPTSIIAYMFYTLGVGKVLSNKSVSLAEIFASSIVFTPYLILPVATIISYNIAVSFSRILYLGLTVIVQVSSTILGAAYLSSIYGMRFERSLLIQVLFYIISTIVFSFLQALNLLTEI